MQTDKKYRTLIGWIENELSNYLPVDESAKLASELNSQNVHNLLIIEDMGADEGNEAKDILYHSLKFRKYFDLLITKLEVNLTPQKYLSFLEKLASFCQKQSEIKVTKEICNKILDIAVDPKYQLHKAKAFLLLSDSMLDQAFWKESLQFLKQARKIFKDVADERGIAECENRMGIILSEEGKIKIAIKHFENALSYLSENQHHYLILKIKINLGILHIIQNKPDSAKKMFDESLALVLENGDESSTALLYHNLGMLYSKTKNLSKAEKYLNKSLAISNRNNFHYISSISYCGKAHLQVAYENLDAAQKYASIGLNIAISINDRLSIADFYKVFGIIQRERKEYDSAESYFLTSIRLNEENGNKLNYSESSKELGVLYSLMGELEKSNKYFTKAMQFYKGNSIEEEELEEYLNN